MNKIKKVIIPAAGLGTRFLPATKSLPKEMFPIIDTPTLQYIVEEAHASGIEEVGIVVSVEKPSIKKHFEIDEALENHFNGQGLYRCVWNKLYRKYLFDNLRFPKRKVAEDLHTTYKLFFKANKVGLIDFVGYYYYIRENSIMGKGGLKLIISTYEGIKDQNEFITESANILKLKINDIYFRTLIKTFSYLENYTGTENIEKYKIEVSNELKRKDIEIKGKLNILKLGFNIMPQLTSKVVQRLVNERER